jgi:hypothetical protein|tara:strand:+ start:293 stop:709 length:417 start_codon:yes stop_codon:yes gene_type:complete
MDKFTNMANKILSERVYENQYSADENEEDIESKVFDLVKAGKIDDATNILNKLRFSNPEKFKLFLNKINNSKAEIEDAENTFFDKSTEDAIGIAQRLSTGPEKEKLFGPDPQKEVNKAYGAMMSKIANKIKAAAEGIK